MKIDFHIHSEYSFDSLMKIERIIDIGKKKGLNGLAITDHGSVKGGLEGEKLGKNRGIVVIPGIEVVTDECEILGLFLNEGLKSRTALDTIDEVRRQGGISVIAHPFKRGRKIGNSLLETADGIEGFNSRCSYSENRSARKIAAEYNLPMTAGSDAHFYCEIGRAQCIIEKADNLDDIRRAVVRRETRMMGTQSCLYVEPLSQIIRAFKTNKPEVMFRNVIFGSMAISYQRLKQKLNDILQKEEHECTSNRRRSR